MTKKYKLPKFRRKILREASRRYRANLKKLGLIEVRVRCHPKDAARIKIMASHMLQRRMEADNENLA